jgi:hypothetical protein
MESLLLIIAQVGFVLLTIIYFYLLIKEFKHGASQIGWDEGKRKKFLGRILLALCFWMVFVSFWSLTGIMANFSIFPLNFMPVIAIPFIVSMIVTFSPSFKEIIKIIPPHRLIRLQSFRIFVELLLWILFIDTIIPIQMTFEGKNFDILAGVSAPVIAWLASHKKLSRSSLIAWNIISLLLLINIVVIAILSAPSPWQVFTNEPANTIVASFPVVLLPGFLVPLAYTLHFLSLQQLFMGAKASAK